MCICVSLTPFPILLFFPFFKNIMYYIFSLKHRAVLIDQG